MSSNDETNPIKELAEREVEASKLSALSLAFIGMSLAFIAHSVYSIFSFGFDKSVPLVSCPRSYDLDSPVLMKRLKSLDAVNYDRWIRGFVRKFVLAQFPRSEKDVAPFFKYIIDHSTGPVRYKYKKLYSDREEIERMVASQMMYKFYPKFSDDVESPFMRIRKSPDHSNRWVVEVDGFLVKKMMYVIERYTPTLRYEIEIGEATQSNPEGLYVVDASLDQITDFVSGKKETL